MKLSHAAPLAALLTIAAAPLARAQSLPFRCGPDCTTPGRWVLCSDGFDQQMATAGGVRLEAFLEAACQRFELPAPSVNLVGFAALFGPGDMAVLLLEAFLEKGAAAPGRMITEQGVGVQGGSDTGFSGLELPVATATTAFRICLRQQLDDLAQTSTIRELRVDADGTGAGNTTFVPGMGWGDATARGVRGDFVIRAVVRYNDLAPWQAGGSCVRNPNDAGVIVLPDAAAPGDAGGPVAGDAGADAGVVAPQPDAGAAAGGAPTITLISPRQGSNVAPVDVVVTGTNFAQGLTLKIGTISAEDVSVAGSTTIVAKVPANIAPGKYDVIVKNPDNQAAVLPMGYEVLGQTTGDPPKDGGCSCTAADEPSSTSAALLLVAGLTLSAWRRRRRG